MDKLEEFKAFIKDKPFLATQVKDGNITWQTLYETYDMFGPEHEFFKEPKEENEEATTNQTDTSNGSPTAENVNRFFKQLQKVDTKKISDGLENIKKIVGLVDEFRPNLASSSKLTSTRIKPFRKYND